MIESSVSVILICLFLVLLVWKSSVNTPFLHAAKVHEVQTIYQVQYYKMFHNIGAKDRISVLYIKKLLTVHVCRSSNVSSITSTCYILVEYVTKHSPYSE